MGAKNLKTVFVIQCFGEEYGRTVIAESVGVCKLGDVIGCCLQFALLITIMSFQMNDSSKNTEICVINPMYLFMPHSCQNGSNILGRYNIG